MFEMDDDFDIDEVLDTVSMIEEEAIRATNSAVLSNKDKQNSDTQKNIHNNELLQPSLKCPLKRKSDTDADINSKLQKRSSEDCLHLLETINAQQTSQKPISPNMHASSLENQTPSASKFPPPKPPSIWKMKADGNSSGYEMRTIQAACQRKFPGPAGLLPERATRTSYALNETSGTITPSQAQIPVCSQSSQTLDVGPWQALRYDLKDARDLLDKYTVSWVKQRVATRRLPGQKIPFLAAVLHNVDASSQDPVIVLRDKTGLINGTIHRSVWEYHGGQLVQGSALILRLVGVACTGAATQQRLYVNVTSNNIVTIYSPSATDGDVNVTEVHPLDIAEIRQRIREWEEKSKADATAAANSSGQNSSLFSSILDRTPLRQLAPPSPGVSANLPRPTNPPRLTNPSRLNQYPRPTNLPRTTNPPKTTNPPGSANSPLPTNPQRTFNPNIRNRTPSNLGNGGNSCGAPNTSNGVNRAELSNPPNQQGQNKGVTSTQNSEVDKMSIDISTFLEGLDTDLLFDDF